MTIIETQRCFIQSFIMFSQQLLRRTRNVLFSNNKCLKTPSFFSWDGFEPRLVSQFLLRIVELSISLIFISQVVHDYKIHHGLWRPGLLLDGLASGCGYSEEGRCQWMRLYHLLHRCGQFPLNCFRPGRSQ